MRRWDERPTSVLAARVDKLKEESTNKGNLARMNLAPVSCECLPRQNRSEDDKSDPLEGTSTSRMDAQGVNDSQS